MLPWLITANKTYEQHTFWCHDCQTKRTKASTVHGRNMSVLQKKDAGTESGIQASLQTTANERGAATSIAANIRQAAGEGRASVAPCLNGGNLWAKPCCIIQMADSDFTITSPKDALTTRVACPSCGKVSQLRNLSYRHICKVPVTQATLLKRHNRKLQALQDRAMKRLKKPATEEADGPSLEESSTEF